VSVCVCVCVIVGVDVRVSDCVCVCVRVGSRVVRMRGWGMVQLVVCDRSWPSLGTDLLLVEHRVHVLHALPDRRDARVNRVLCVHVCG
jgi:hypothetical protein